MTSVRLAGFGSLSASLAGSPETEQGAQRNSATMPIIYFVIIIASSSSRVEDRLQRMIDCYGRYLK
jgi:hypothetical protein